MEIAGNNGVARLPPGFRFHPTDEELVTQYLRRKAFGLPLPANVIADDADLANHNNPWDLLGWMEGEKEKFFFVSGGGGRTRRSAASCGYWRSSGRDKPVYFSSGRDRLLVGMKKTLVFHLRKPAPATARAFKTKWVLHEYRLAGAGAAARVNPSHGSPASPAESWVVCRIFMERSSKKARESITGAEDDDDDDSSSSSSSSCVTEIPEEESSTSDDEASSRSPAAAPPPA